MASLGHYHNVLLRYMPVIEGALLAAAIYIGVYTRFGFEIQSYEANVLPIWPKALVFAVVHLLTFACTGLYNKRLRDSLEGVVVRVFLSFVAGTLVMGLVFYLVPSLYLGRGIFLISAAVAFVFLLVTRLVFFRLLYEEGAKRRVLVMGVGARAKSITYFRRRTDLIGLKIVGFVRCQGDEVRVPEDRIVAVDGGLADWVVANDIDEVVVAADDRRQGVDMHELLLCRTRGVGITDLATFFERETGRLKLDVMDPSWLAYSEGFQSSFLGDWVKRLFDIGVSLILLVGASPVILLTAVAIRLESRGPILYRQVRVGENDREFEVLKFRSMRIDAEKDGQAQWAQKNDPRVTRVGNIIRRYRIDEIPQIYNILRGEMSFVGPRPERPDFVRELEARFPYYADRHRVPPGLTGWAQISYPYGSSAEDAFEKLQFDLYYVKNRNLFLDLVILLQTAEVVLWGRGAR